MNKIIEGLQAALEYAACDHSWVWVKRATNGKTNAWFCAKCGSYKHEAEQQ